MSEIASFCSCRPVTRGRFGCCTRAATFAASARHKALHCAERRLVALCDRTSCQSIPHVMWYQLINQWVLIPLAMCGRCGSRMYCKCSSYLPCTAVVDPAWHVRQL